MAYVWMCLMGPWEAAHARARAQPPTCALRKQGWSGFGALRTPDERARLLPGHDGVLYAVVHAPLHLLAHVAGRAEALYLARKARGVALRVPALNRGYAAPPLRTAACSGASSGPTSHSLDQAPRAASTSLPWCSTGCASGVLGRSWASHAAKGGTGTPGQRSTTSGWPKKDAGLL